MALFGSKKKVTKEKEVAPKAAPKAAKAEKEVEAPKAKVVAGLRAVIRRPRFTEKAANLTTNDVYTFEVTPGASKHDIVRAIKALYKVTPRKVNVVNTIGKKVSLRTRRGSGTKNSARKAYVYLKKGDKIDFAA